MTTDVTRRRFVSTLGVGAASLAAGAALTAGAASAEQSSSVLKIIGVACSMRAGKTTAQALNMCLAAAKAVAPERIEVELIELAGLKLPTQLAAGMPLEPGERDDFPPIEVKLSDPQLVAIVVGTPVYFANMSALCKAFIERCGVFRKNDFALSGKVAGVVAVASARNGGQELVIRSVQASLMCHEMLVIGDGRPTSHFGGTLWNDGKDDISKDEFGVSTVQNLGRHIARVALARKSP
jgi:multimeric flavodoxin WrbA